MLSQETGCERLAIKAAIHGVGPIAQGSLHFSQAANGQDSTLEYGYSFGLRLFRVHGQDLPGRIHRGRTLEAQAPAKLLRRRSVGQADREKGRPKQQQETGHRL